MRNKYFLLRHGEAVINKKDILSSWPEKNPSPLTKRGKKQIEILAKKLKKKKIDLIFSSDLLRSRQTAEIIDEELGLKTRYDKRLRENNFGIFNGKTAAEFREFFVDPAKRFWLSPPKGENYTEIRKRMWNFLKEIDKKYKNKIILIISHGDPIWLLIGKIKGLTNKELLEEKYKQRKFYPQVGQLQKLK